MKVKLKYWRKRRALTLRDITAKTGLSSQTLVRIEQGHEPRPSTLRKLAEALDVPLDDLIEVEEETSGEQAEPESSLAA